MDGFAAAVAAVAPALDAELCEYLGGILADDPPQTAAALAAALADLLLGFEVGSLRWMLCERERERGDGG